ncbi:MAG: ATP-binding protein [Acetatifactor sp.]
MPLPFILAVLGTIAIGYGSNALQSAYKRHFFQGNYRKVFELTGVYTYEIEYDRQDIAKYIIYRDESGNEHVIPVGDIVPEGKLEKLGYVIVSDAQFILIPVWVILCVVMGSFLFYKKEIEGGLHVLLSASEKIANNELAFEIPETKKNEIGLVCDSFERMRKSLYETNVQNIRILEESRRLNAVFSHDIRTPITVMKGYVELLEKYVPEGKVSREKECEILGMMSAQVSRLENYAVSMSSIQKLEDLSPNPVSEDYEQFASELENSCMLIDERVIFDLQGEVRERITVDKELVFEVVENIVSNAARYAREKIEVKLACDKDILNITVLDDGNGFSDKILNLFGKPFLREDKNEDKEHFGLGIYISKLLCEKCGGTLVIDNRNGAFVQATFKMI